MTKMSPVSEAGLRYLQKIIGGLQEGIILIEPDGSLSWANSAALEMHGVDMLPALGATVQGYCKKFALSYRNNHLLKDKQYPICRAWAGEAFSKLTVMLTDADGEGCRMLEMHSVMLDDESGERGSVALVINDITERIVAEQRFEKAFNANPAPALICRLSDFRYLRANQGFLDMTGYSHTQIVGRSAYELDVLNDAEHRELAIANIAENKTVPQMQALLPLPGGKRKYVIVAGQPLEVAGDACMLFTFIDLDPRKQVEDELRQSEEKFSTAFRLAPIPMLLGTLERLLDVNEAFLATTGYDNDDLANKKLALSNLWAKPDEYRKFEILLNNADRVWQQEFQLRTDQGVLLDCLIYAEIVTIAGQRCTLAVIQDISDYKQSESQLVAAIDTVMQDASWFSRSLIEKLAQIRRPSSPGHTAAELADLTPREREVFDLICAGTSDAQIGEALQLSRNTVRNHVAAIYSKIDVHRRSEAIIWGRERGIVGAGKPARDKDKS